MASAEHGGVCIQPTAVGPIGVAWSGDALHAISLAHATPQRTLDELQRRCRLPVTQQQPPRSIRPVLARIAAHLDGNLDPLSDVAIDLRGISPFRQQILQLCRSVGPGETSSYGELAKRLGKAGASRAVGSAMSNNPLPLVIPCHRICASDGPGWFSSHGNLATKLRLLTIEGADLASWREAAPRQLRRADPKLAAVIRRVGRCTLEPQADPSAFASLVRAIVHQQVSMAAGRTIIGRLSEAMNDRNARLSARRLLAASDQRLREIGLSRQKASYLRALAEHERRGYLRGIERLDDEALIERLTAIRGVGRWTAQMYLIFQLGRLDVLPVDDLGVQNAVTQLYALRQRPTPQRIERLAEAWRPYRSIASWYLWRSLDSGGL
ncbi:MAG: methylated-DNA--[protein]-cysteine S-methyltransferase [Deltaproteobacteria bacterium]|nr:methylated-DNA--[protein]-cysteine S-methyltransferase [Deltaproteobacteria bacterium]